MGAAPERDEAAAAAARRKKANIRLALLLALTVLAIYVGFIVSHL